MVEETLKVPARRLDAQLHPDPPPGGKVVLRIKRREDASTAERWEEFEVPYKPGMNVITCLMEIQRNPVTRDGKKTTPVAWDSSCLEEVCGACSMLVNGRARQACT